MSSRVFSCETFDMGAMKEEGEGVPAKLASSAAVILREKILKAFEKA